MTYFPAPVWNSLKEFFIPPSLPKGRHPCAQALQSELPLPMLALKTCLDTSKKRSIYQNYFQILKKFFRLHYRSGYCTRYDQRSSPRHTELSQQHRFQMEMLYPQPYPYPSSYLYSHDNIYGFALRKRGRGFKALVKSELREHLTNNDIKTTNKMQKRDLVRLCLSF